MPTKPGVTSYAMLHTKFQTFVMHFNVCLTETMKKEIIFFSNLQGNAVFEDFAVIDDIEFDANLGLLILIGMYLLKFSFLFCKSVTG